MEVRNQCVSYFVSIAQELLKMADYPDCQFLGNTSLAELLWTQAIPRGFLGDLIGYLSSDRNLFDKVSNIELS